MKLSEFFTNNGNRKYRYIGEVLGRNEMTETGRRWAAIIIEMDADAEIGTHPAYGHYRDGDEWYTEGNRIGWVSSGSGLTEISFEQLDE